MLLPVSLMDWIPESHILLNHQVLLRRDQGSLVTFYFTEQYSGRWEKNKIDLSSL